MMNTSGLNYQRRRQSPTTLYVSDLAPDVTEAMLFEKFSTAGYVLSIKVCRDMITRRSLGYAYIIFQYPDDAECAMEMLNFQDINGSRIRVVRQKTSKSYRNSKIGCIIIMNLEKSIDTKTLYNRFIQFGNILSCIVATDENGDSKGHGYIHFELDVSARIAFSIMNGMNIYGQKVTVTYVCEYCNSWKYAIYD